MLNEIQVICLRHFFCFRYLFDKFVGDIYLNKLRHLFELCVQMFEIWVMHLFELLSERSTIDIVIYDAHGTLHMVDGIW